MSAFPVLLGDIGGTNTRFAILPEPGAPLQSLTRFQTDQHVTPVEAILHLLKDQVHTIQSAMMAVATRVDSTRVQLTNASWVVDAEEIGRAFGLQKVTLLNDYTPLCAATSVLPAREGDIRQIGSHAPREGIKVVLGPGTGLGVGALVPLEIKHAIFSTEAGHMDFGPRDAGELSLWPYLERVGGRVSAETVLSGRGLLRIARAIADEQGIMCPIDAPEDVLNAAREGDALALHAVQLFVRWLGRFAGDIALAFEASGGVFIAGGIAPRMVDYFEDMNFRAAFDDKAPHQVWTSTLPVAIITNEEPALLGLATLAQNPGRFSFRSSEWKRVED